MNYFLVVFIVIMAFFIPAYYGFNYGFGAQCSNALYKNADFDNCVKRKVNGGGTYE